ncbi:cold-shock protein [Paenibacillus sp. TRM 82003]|nr:cold-shock protein [Paenibacillus sp. TRM 82003]
MYYSRRRPIEDLPCEPTAIWSCEKEACNGWMRDNYSFEAIPTCSQCGSPMNRGTKSLPVLQESGYDVKKAIKKLEEKANAAT